MPFFHITLLTSELDMPVIIFLKKKILCFNQICKHLVFLNKKHNFVTSYVLRGNVSDILDSPVRPICQGRQNVQGAAFALKYNCVLPG